MLRVKEPCNDAVIVVNVMSTVRTPAVAGLFYPADTEVLRTQVRQLLDQVKPVAECPPKAIIAPHAGYMYSGSIAASVYARLKAARDSITRVILLGPSHRVGFRGITVSQMQAFATPLGQVPVDQAAVEQVRQLPKVGFLEQAHAQEHSLEVHLPFLQEVLATFQFVPLVVGDARPAEVAAVLEPLWGGRETLIVVSSDLSHYHDYQTAQRLDNETSAAIEALRYEAIGYDQACGRNALNGLLWLAKRKHLQAKTVDLRNSGDTAGSRDQVVGYGAYVVH